MRKLRLVKRIIEAILFFLAGFLIKIAFSKQLDYVSAIFMLICAVMIVVNMLIGQYEEQIRRDILIDFSSKSILNSQIKDDE